MASVENQRIRVTKTMLKQALLKLLEEKPLEKITVLELCKTAEINRATFYKYYGSPFDLFDEIEADFLAQLDNSLSKIASSKADALTAILGHLYEQRELFCLLSQSGNFAQHLSSLQSIGILFHNMMDTDKYQPVQSKYMKLFTFQGTYAVLCSWLRSENPEPVLEIAAVLGTIKTKLS